MARKATGPEAFRRFRRALLHVAGAEQAEAEAKAIITQAMNCDVTGLFLNAKRVMTGREAHVAQWVLKRRLSGMPLQYAAEKAHFMGLELYVDKRVLIPRPETELLVEMALEHVRGGKKALDLGTGSGCIAVSLAALDPYARVHASDKYASALAVARINARRHGVRRRIRFIRSDMFARIHEQYDLIVANPPYIPQDEFTRLDASVRRYEPIHALVAQDGLRYYRIIASQAGNHLAKGGLLLLEIGHDQAGRVTDMLRDNGFYDIRRRRDYGGRDRIVSAFAHNGGS